MPDLERRPDQRSSQPSTAPDYQLFDGELLPLQEGVRVPDALMANIISALCNNEAKLLLLLVLSNGGFYTAQDMDNEMKRIQGGEQGIPLGWEQRGQSFKYCQCSLERIGTVARGVKHNPILGIDAQAYEITDLGRQVIPLDGSILDYSFRHPEIPLARLFSDTQSVGVPDVVETDLGDVEHKNRAPEVRRKILRILVDAEGPLRECDIAKALGETYRSKVRDHLEDLSYEGIIVYRSAMLGHEGYIRYRLVPDRPSEHPPKYAYFPTLTQRVYEAVKMLDAKGNFSINDVVQQLRMKEEYQTQTDEYLHNYVTYILRHLKQCGYVVNDTLFDWEHTSETIVLNPKLAAIKELLNIIDDFQDQKPEALAKGRQLAEDIIHHSEQVNMLMQKARRASRHTDRVSTEEWTTRTIEIVKACPGITSRQLREKLARERKRVSGQRVMSILYILREQGVLSFTEVSHVRRWRAVENGVPEQGSAELERTGGVLYDGSQNLGEQSVTTREQTYVASGGEITKDMLLDPKYVQQLLDEGHAIVRVKGRKTRQSVYWTVVEIGPEGATKEANPETGEEYFVLDGKRVVGKKVSFPPRTLRI